MKLGIATAAAFEAVVASTTASKSPTDETTSPLLESTTPGRLLHLARRRRYEQRLRREMMVLSSSSSPGAAGDGERGALPEGGGGGGGAFSGPADEGILDGFAADRRRGLSHNLGTGLGKDCTTTEDCPNDYTDQYFCDTDSNKCAFNFGKACNTTEDCNAVAPHCQTDINKCVYFENCDYSNWDFEKDPFSRRPLSAPQPYTCTYSGVLGDCQTELVVGISPAGYGALPSAGITEGQAYYTTYTVGNSTVIRAGDGGGPGGTYGIQVDGVDCASVKVTQWSIFNGWCVDLDCSNTPTGKAETICGGFGQVPGWGWKPVVSSQITDVLQECKPDRCDMCSGGAGELDRTLADCTTVGYALAAYYDAGSEYCNAAQQIYGNSYCCSGQEPPLDYSAAGEEFCEQSGFDESECVSHDDPLACECAWEDGQCWWQDGACSIPSPPSEAPAPSAPAPSAPAPTPSSSASAVNKAAAAASTLAGLALAASTFSYFCM